MTKTLIHRILIFLLVSSCIHEKEIPCDTHLCFVYDYNLQYIDLFSREVNQLSVFVFDNENKLHSFHIDEAKNTFPENYKMPILLEKEDYTFIVWAGLYEELYDFSITTRAEYTIEDFNIRPKYDDNGKIKMQFPPLWHGKLEKMWDKETPGIIRLVKDYNTFRIIMRNLEEDGNDVDINDFDIFLSCSNGHYNYNNEPQDNVYEYYPYYASNIQEIGAVAELNTLRLMANQDNYLTIIHRKTGENVLGKNLNLNAYINALRLLDHNNLPFQEYLDRENQYNIIFFYRGYDREKGLFGHITFEINEWQFREDDISY